MSPCRNRIQERNSWLFSPPEWVQKLAVSVFSVGSGFVGSFSPVLLGQIPVGMDTVVLTGGSSYSEIWSLEKGAGVFQQSPPAPAGQSLIPKLWHHSCLTVSKGTPKHFPLSPHSFNENRGKLSWFIVFFLNPGDSSYSRHGGAWFLGRDSGLEGDPAHGREAGAGWSLGSLPS